MRETAKGLKRCDLLLCGTSLATASTIRAARVRSTFREDCVRGAARGGHLAVGEPFSKLRIAKFYDTTPIPTGRRILLEYLLGLDANHAHSMDGAQAYLARFLETFKEFGPSQRAGSFTIDQAMEKLRQQLGD